MDNGTGGGAGDGVLRDGVLADDPLISGFFGGGGGGATFRRVVSVDGVWLEWGGGGGPWPTADFLSSMKLFTRREMPYFSLMPLTFCLPASIWSLWRSRKSWIDDLMLEAFIPRAGGGGAEDAEDAELLVFIRSKRDCSSLTGALPELFSPIPNAGTDTPDRARLDVACEFNCPSE